MKSTEGVYILLCLVSCATQLHNYQTFMQWYSPEDRSKLSRDSYQLTLDRWWAAFKFSFFFFSNIEAMRVHEADMSFFFCLFVCMFCGSENFHWSQIYKHNNHTSLKQIWMLSRTSVNSSSWAPLPNRTWTKREDTRRGVINVTIISDYEDMVFIFTIVWHQTWGQFRPGLAATVGNGEMQNKIFRIAAHSGRWRYINIGGI